MRQNTRMFRAVGSPIVCSNCAGGAAPISYGGVCRAIAVKLFSLFTATRKIWCKLNINILQGWKQLNTD